MTTVTDTFERSYIQRIDALAQANAIRSRRAELKRDLKAGRVLLLPLIVSPPDWIGTMKLYELLLAVPKWGRVKANRFLRQANVLPSKTVGGLSERQRREVEERLRAVIGTRRARNGS